MWFALSIRWMVWIAKTFVWALIAAGFAAFFLAMASLIAAGIGILAAASKTPAESPQV